MRVGEGPHLRRVPSRGGGWFLLIGLLVILTLPAIAVAADPPSSDRILAGEVLSVPEAEVREAEGEPELPHFIDAGWKGEPVCEVLHDTEAVRIARCSFPPGVGHEKHFHRPHFGYVLTGGTMRIEDADGVETVETRAGATWTSDETSVHQVVNVGDTTTSYLIVESKEP